MIGDKSKDRQEFFQWHVDNEYFLDSQFDFSDCEDGEDVIEAICKMLIDNYGIGHEGSYIKGLIQMACDNHAEKTWREYAEYAEHEEAEENHNGK